jgi:tRNA pseudouridine38-40 synthase
VTGQDVVEPAGTPEQSGAGGLGAVGGPDPGCRLRLEVAYDGTHFHGWARQPGLRSVQGELEQALRATLRVVADQPVRVAVAGRTDAGVHAIGQVCHVDVPAGDWAALVGPRAAGPRARPGLTPAPVADPDPSLVLRRRLNGVLPPDLRVRRVGLAPDGFDARWSASWRRYSYLVADDPADQDPRSRGHVLWHPRALDLAAMRAAATRFLGEHDFAAFCRAREGASSVRTVHDIGWRRVGRIDPTGAAPTGLGEPRVRASSNAAHDPAGRGTAELEAGIPGLAGHPASGPLEFTVRADAFCHSMVRSLVGAFLAVGDGRWPVDRPAELLAAAERVPGIATAPAHGLTLVEVGYPPDAELAAQAQRARRWRGR